MDNAEIAAVLEDVATLLEIQGANPFRIRAYQNAARVIEEHAVALRKVVEAGGDLTELPGVGKDLARYIGELIETGKLGLLEELTATFPASLIELTRLPGVGAKKARKLFDELGVATLDALEAAAGAGNVAQVEGFGAKSEKKILDGIAAHRRRQGRVSIADADRHVDALLAWLAAEPAVTQVTAAGSYRRRRDTVGDVDLLAAASDPGSVVKRFTAYDGVREVLLTGETKTSVRLAGGLQVDLRIVPPQSWGAALQYFTGSKEHNVKLRKRAVAQGLRVSEYGVFRVPEGKGESDDPFAGEYLAGADETEVYAALDLPWIPPELREDRGEIEAASEGRLPPLIEVGDMRGDLQMHSTWSDGKDTLEEMLVACAARGYEYFAITDHSKALAMTGGLDVAKLRRQWKEIEELQERHREIRILKGMEVDILADGGLDLHDEMLAQLDVALVSVHSRFDLPAAEQTERILRAIGHPAVHILAHPTGRLINRRDPMAFDVDEVLRAAVEYGVVVELNAHPDRLDLKDTHLMRATELGLKVVISTDAHRTADLDLIRYGVDQARRAWLTPDDVINTYPLPRLLASLRMAQ